MVRITDKRIISDLFMFEDLKVKNKQYVLKGLS